jgi:molecular chaperone GrpE
MSGSSEESVPTSTTESSSQPEAATAAASAPADGAKDPVADARADAARFKDQALRALADLDNFRKRARKEVDDAKKAGREEMLREFLPVFDNLERALQSAEKATDVKAVSDGLGMILRLFADMLGRNNFKRTPGVGTLFDPLMHEAIQQLETDEHPPGTIVAEMQPGYMQGERLVRAALVVVAKPKPAATADAAGGEKGDATTSGSAGEEN